MATGISAISQYAQVALRPETGISDGNKAFSSLFQDMLIESMPAIEENSRENEFNDLPFAPGNRQIKGSSEGESLQKILLAMLFMILGGGLDSENGLGSMMMSMSGLLSGISSKGSNPVWENGAADSSLDAMPADAMPDEAMQGENIAGSVGEIGEHPHQKVTKANSSSIIPIQAHKAVTPGITSTQSNRNPGLYRAVIDQFSVESHPRYAVNKQGKGDTYCNIFMWDVTRAMGAEIPHYVDPKTLAPRYYPDTKGARELNANGIYNWLGKVGEKYGWVKVTPAKAQALANEGKPVVTAKYNNSGPGHVQVVCPSKDGKYDASRGVTVAQAGRKLYNYAPITKIYGSSSLSKVVYYAHP